MEQVHMTVTTLPVIASPMLAKVAVPWPALATLARPFTKSVEQAAASLVFALCGEAELLSQSGHVYINNCFPCKPSPAACSDSMARLVWEYTLTELETKLGPSWDKL